MATGQPRSGFGEGLLTYKRKRWKNGLTLGERSCNVLNSLDLLNRWRTALRAKPRENPADRVEARLYFVYPAHAGTGLERFRSNQRARPRT
jgi:hypothetical protein